MHQRMGAGLTTSVWKQSNILMVWWLVNIKVCNELNLITYFVGCLRLDGKKMPLKFYYPTWRNGERVSGTLDGNGYYTLLRYIHLLSRGKNFNLLFSIIRYHCFPFIRNANNGSLANQCWQQVSLFLNWFLNLYLSKDGASPHRSKRALNYLQSSFGTNLLALGSQAWGGHEWSPNSPDLAPLDFCVWGVMKVKVFFRFYISIDFLIFRNMSSPIQCLKTETNWWRRLKWSGSSTLLWTWFREQPKGFSIGLRRLLMPMGDTSQMSDYCKEESEY